MGAYTACLDLALGLASPALGLIASRAGLGAVFLASTLVVLCGASIAVRLLFAPPLSDGAADRSPGGQNEILCFGDSGARSDRFVVGSSEPGESHAEIERCAHADAD